MFKVNEGKTDRVVRIILAILLTIFAVTTMQYWLLIIAAVLFITGLTGFCGLYKLFGISTCPRK